MAEIHAPDPMGSAAHKAALLAGHMEARLLLASSPNASREERAEAATRFFRQWRALVRAVKLLEDVAPRCAERGYDEDAEAQEFIEARAEKSA